MSTVKSKKVQFGVDASASNNFTIYQPATPDGTLRIGVGNADSPTEVGRFTSAGYKPAIAPAFSVKLSSNQSISANVTTKITWNTEVFDTADCFDNATNYRWTPTVAGYYQVNAFISWSGSGTTQGNLYIYKNGSSYAHVFCPGSGFGYFNAIPITVYMNGTTDYLECYARNSSNEAVGSGVMSQFSGHLLSQA